jgi:hypothetical protein
MRGIEEPDSYYAAALEHFDLIATLHNAEFVPCDHGIVSACSSSGSAQHRMRTVRRRIYAAHLTVCRGIIEQLEQVEIDAFPTAFVTD